MTFLNKQTSMVAIALSIGVLSGSAYAAPISSSGGLCSTGDSIGGIAVSDMTFSGDNADDCYGVVAGNDDGDNIWTDTGWTLLAKDNTPDNPGDPDDLSGIINGIEFTLDATPEGGDTSGDWTLSWLDVGAPGYNLTVDFVGVLKGGSSFASYLFEDLLFTENDSGTGTWEIAFTNKGGQTPDLSHLSLYYKDPGWTPPTEGDPVPEPTSLMLLGLGLLGFVGARRKKS